MLVDAVFDTLGESALWGASETPARIRRASADDDIGMGEMSIISRGDRLRVRKRDVIDPARGDRVVLVDEAGEPTGEVLTVSGEPMLLRNLVWQMPFVEG